MTRNFCLQEIKLVNFIRQNGFIKAKCQQIAGCLARDFPESLIRNSTLFLGKFKKKQKNQIFWLKNF